MEGTGERELLRVQIGSGDVIALEEGEKVDKGREHSVNLMLLKAGGVIERIGHIFQGRVGSDCCVAELRHIGFLNG